MNEAASGPAPRAVVFMLAAAVSAVCGCASAPTVAPAAAPSSSAGKVAQFIAAFNAHDPHRMAALAHPDIEWLSIEADAVTVETRGAGALRDAMTGYFQSLPTVQTQVTVLEDTGRRVTVRERVRWRGKTGEREQSALAVYEFDEGAIRRVYYFPAEK